MRHCRPERQLSHQTVCPLRLTLHVEDGLGRTSNKEGRGVGHHTDLYALHFHRNRGPCVWALDLLHHKERDLRERPLLERKAKLPKLIVADSDDRCGLWRSVDSSRHDRAASRDPRRRMRSSRALNTAIPASSKDYPLWNGLRADEKFRRRSNQFAVCRGSHAAATLSLHHEPGHSHRCPSRFSGDSPSMLNRGLPGWAGPSLTQGG